MKHLKPLNIGKLIKESAQEESTNKISYEKISNIISNAKYKIISFVEDKMENDLKISWYYILENAYHQPKLPLGNDKGYIYDIQEGRNGLILEYLMDNGEEYVNMDDAPIETLLDIFANIENVTIADVIEEAINNERPQQVTEILKNHEDLDLDDFNSNNGESLLDCINDHEYSIEDDIYEIANVQKYLFKADYDMFIEKVVDAGVDIDTDLLKSYELQDYLFSNDEDKAVDLILRPEVTLADGIFDKYETFIRSTELGI